MTPKPAPVKPWKEWRIVYPEGWGRSPHTYETRKAARDAKAGYCSARVIRVEVRPVATKKGPANE